MQEEDLTGDRIAHLIGESADLVDDVAEHCDLSVNESVIS